jgi:putative flippase GtrA
LSRPAPEASSHAAAGAGSRPTGAGSRFWEWIRHHFTAIAATVIDYSTMVGAVELGHVGPVTAVPMAAAAGAVTSFTLNRHFTYRLASRSSLRGQLWRYALVSGCSLGLNTLGEFLFLKVHLHYFLARVITSTVVSNVWNYPLMRFFVFSERPPSRA